MPISEADLIHMRRVVELARGALDAGDGPFGSVLTSGERCPMCSAAHTWVGLGRIVYVGSAGAAPSAVARLPITTVAPGLPVEGPVDGLVPDVRALIERAVRSG